MLDESKKIVLTLMFSTIAIIFLIYFSFHNTTPKTDNADVFVETPVNQSTFLNKLANAKHVYIIMDLRNVSDDGVKRNIMQCGVDLAGSRGLVSKNITIASLTEQACYFSSSLNSPQKKPISFCLHFRANSQTITFYITNLNKTYFFNNEMKIGVGKAYKIGDCHVELT